MGHVALLIVITGFSMALRDVMSTSATYFVARERAGLAGLFDCLSDTFGLFSLGAPLAVIAQSRLSVASVAAVLALWVGSMVGTFAGLRLAKSLNAVGQAAR